MDREGGEKGEGTGMERGRKEKEEGIAEEGIYV